MTMLLSRHLDRSDIRPVRLERDPFEVVLMVLGVLVLVAVLVIRAGALSSALGQAADPGARDARAATLISDEGHPAGDCLPTNALVKPDESNDATGAEIWRSSLCVAQMIAAGMAGAPVCPTVPFT